MADTVYLKNGGQINGQIISQTKTRIRIKKSNGQIQTIPKADVRRVEFGKIETNPDQPEVTTVPGTNREANRLVEEAGVDLQPRTNQSDKAYSSAPYLVLRARTGQGRADSHTSEEREFNVLSDVQQIIASPTSYTERINLPWSNTGRRFLELGLFYEQDKFSVESMLQLSRLKPEAETFSTTPGYTNGSRRHGKENRLDYTALEVVGGYKIYQNQNWTVRILLGANWYNQDHDIKQDSYQAQQIGNNSSVSTTQPIKLEMRQLMRGPLVGLQTEYNWMSDWLLYAHLKYRVVQGPLYVQNENLVMYINNSSGTIFQEITYNIRKINGFTKRNHRDYEVGSKYALDTRNTLIFSLGLHKTSTIFSDIDFVEQHRYQIADNAGAISAGYSGWFTGNPANQLATYLRRKFLGNFRHDSNGSIKGSEWRLGFGYEWKLF